VWGKNGHDDVNGNESSGTIVEQTVKGIEDSKQEAQVWEKRIGKLEHGDNELVKRATLTEGKGG